MNRETVQGSGWLLLLIISILTSVVLGLALVWMSIESTDTAYRLGHLQAQAAEKAELKNKLEVERDRLLSPYELGRAAMKLGMREALPGQIRHLDDVESPGAGQGNDAGKR